MSPGFLAIKDFFIKSIRLYQPEKRDIGGQALNILSKHPLDGVIMLSGLFCGRGYDADIPTKRDTCIKDRYIQRIGHQQ